MRWWVLHDSEAVKELLAADGSGRRGGEGGRGGRAVRLSGEYLRSADGTGKEEGDFVMFLREVRFVLHEPCAGGSVRRL